MKIAVIVWALNVKGGTQRQALSLARKLQENGHLVNLYAVFFSFEDCYKNLLEGLKISYLYRSSPSEEDQFLFPLGFIKNIRFIRFLIRLRKENEMCKSLAMLIDDDTEILNPHDQHIYKVSYYFKKRKNIPSIWMANDIPSIQWQGFKTQEIEGKNISKLRKLLSILVDAYEKRFIQSQDQIIVLDRLNQTAVKKYFNLDSRIVRSGLDINRFLSNKRKIRESVGRQRARILMVGIFFPHRRFEDGIEAIRLLKNWGYNISLTIIGSEVFNREYKGRLKSLVEKHQLEQEVNFLGTVSEDELLENYFKHDIFVFPNHLQTWGLVVFEAMASGLPVVVSKSTGASEVLTNYQNVLLVDPKSPQAIAKAVRELIDNQTLYQKLSNNGFKFVRKNVSWDIYAMKMKNLFKKLRIGTQ